MIIKTHLTLKRVRDTGRETLGVIEDFHGIPFAVTMEPTWLDNMKDASCIPAGDYLCKRVDSPKYGDTFEVTGVPNRTHVLFHWGNLAKNTEACILIAEKFGRLGGRTAILQSKNVPGEGFNEFIQIAKGIDSFWIRIKWCD